MMWDSPIKIIYKDVDMQLEAGVIKAVQKASIYVDKDELLKALQYDRDQYRKGYEDAVERKRGEWIDGREYINSRWKVCSICHKPAHDSCGGDNFCPNCGADMRGEQDG